MHLGKRFVIVALTILLFGCSENPKVPALSQIDQPNLLDKLVSAEYKILIDIEHVSTQNDYRTILAVIEKKQRKNMILQQKTSQTL